MAKLTVIVAKGLKDRKMQRALMQFFKPENSFEVRESRIKAGRQDMIGGCEGLIPANPLKEAIEARHRQANRAVHCDRDNDHYYKSFASVLAATQATHLNRPRQ